MARDISVIKQQIIDQKNALPSLDELNTPSQTGIWSNWAFVTATCINLFEQLLDIYKSAIESLIIKAGAGTLPWIRDRILEFQAGDNVTYSNGVVAYAIVDTTKRIVTRCSVTQGGNKTVNIKVAKSEPPQALTSGELQEIQFYGKQITFAGTQLNIISLNADFLYVNADIYYDGQLPQATVQANVIAAMTAYCQSLSTVENFNGSIIVPAVEVALLNTIGVKYIKLNEVAFRAATIPFGSRTILFNLASGIDSVIAETISGYLVEDTDTGHTFSDSFNYIVA